MASLPIKPLDGAGGYLRWKESLLLRVHTLGVAHVLFEARPAAAKKWARDDALCRGHILCTLSDRLLPDYARFATAAELWRALARTYDVKVRPYHKFDDFCFDRSTGDVFLEQLAHAEALGAAAELSDGAVAFWLRRKILVAMRLAVTHGEMELESIWEVARRLVSAGVDLWYKEEEEEEDEEEEEEETTTSRRKRARRRARSCASPR